MDPTSHYQSWCSDVLDPATHVTQASCWIHLCINSEVDQLIWKFIVHFDPPLDVQYDSVLFDDVPELQFAARNPKQHQHNRGIREKYFRIEY